MPWSVQSQVALDQVGLRSEEPGPLEGAPAHGRGVEPDDLQGPFQQKSFHDFMIES